MLWSNFLGASCLLQAGLPNVRLWFFSFCKFVYIKIKKLAIANLVQSWLSPHISPLASVWLCVRAEAVLPIFIYLFTFLVSHLATVSAVET